MTTRTRIPDTVESVIADISLCSECFPDVATVRLPGGVWEIRATHTPECGMPQELTYA